jgi:hypothetical protein
MPDNRNVRSNNALRDLNAVFVADDADGLSSTRNVALSRGAHTLRIPAVFVPEGCTPPGYPYIPFGRMTLDSDQDGGPEQTTGSSWDTAGQIESAQQQTSPGQPPSDAQVNGPDTPPVAADPGGRLSADPASPLRRSFAQANLAPNDTDGSLVVAASTPVSMASRGPHRTSDASGPDYGFGSSKWQTPLDAGDQAPRNADPSRDAIEAAIRAQTVMPTDGVLLQSIDWAALAKWPQAPLSDTSGRKD